MGLTAILDATTRQLSNEISHISGTPG